MVKITTKTNQKGGIVQIGKDNETNRYNLLCPSDIKIYINEPHNIIELLASINNSEDKTIDELIQLIINYETKNTDDILNGHKKKYKIPDIMINDKNNIIKRIRGKMIDMKYKNKKISGKQILNIIKTSIAFDASLKYKEATLKAENLINTKKIKEKKGEIITQDEKLEMLKLANELKELHKTKLKAELVFKKGIYTILKKTD